MGLVSYIMSIDNFNDTNPLLVDKLNDAKDYLYTCLHGDGDIAQQLGLGNTLNSFNNISNVENGIRDVKNNFSITMESTPTYYYIKNILEKQKNYTTETVMFQEDGNEKESIGNKELINDYINKVIQSGKKWNLENPNDEDCEHAPVSYYPTGCKPKGSPHYTQDSVTDFNKYANIFEKIDGVIDYANDVSHEDSVMKVINDLRDNYTQYLGKYVEVLDFFSNTIGNITSIVRQYSSPNSTFSFLNGKFIGINLQIVLKFLEHSLGGDFFTVGICLCVVGLSLILSISSTIILIVIINIGLKENKMINNNAGTVVSQFDGPSSKPPY